VYRSVLAVIDPGPQPDPALARAVEEARASRARLTLLCAVPPPCGLVCFASVCRETLHAEALAASGRDLRAAVDTVPDDVPLTTVVSPLCLRRAVRREIARGGHDVVVIGSAVRSRWAAVLMRRLLRRCPAPLVRATPQSAPRSAGPLPAPLAGAG
jgi:nucleotide-binding universal stress UspA family protein